MSLSLGSTKLNSFSGTLELALVDQHSTLGANCHKGVVARQYFLSFHAQGASHQVASNIEKTKILSFPSTIFIIFILQKMSLYRLHPE